MFKGLHSLEIEQRDEPIVGPRDVLISVIATGICGSDLHGHTGENGRRSVEQVMGHELAGRVLGWGAEVNEPELCPRIFRHCDLGVASNDELVPLIDEIVSLRSR